MSKKYLILTVVVGLLAFGYYYFTYQFNLFGECGEDVKATQISSDRNFEAKHTVINCGATTDYTTRVEIKDSNSKEFESVVILTGRHEEDLTMDWTSDSNLRVEYTGEPDKIFKYQNKYKNVNIDLSNNGKIVDPK